MIWIETKQLRRLRNANGRIDEIRALHVDVPADVETWVCNAIDIARERNPFSPLEAPPSLAEIDRRLRLQFPELYQ